MSSTVNSEVDPLVCLKNQRQIKSLDLESVIPMLVER